ncbi:conserved hypothetical protein [Thermosulfidibacter takaii ABI70S6]|uniref:DUF5615 domain-containing protein n=1 Tax=Thermosulfidibacter takaii (strain DSM 17441 / JCM 13301 / NBRC 103674 / ABI70S6) TaxID=1298851 RepID=A0A0S3QSH4_THET7|nr:DUF5615 family PIN-like protein [Thermosulfidibacter takaii]BAT71296.1 conserved hypothetical protein [Thermosulfidibacter takaii ABI70S6]
MKLLIDNPLSPLVCKRLNELGYDAVHVRQLNMHKARDSEIFDYALANDMVVVSADTDFGAILARRRSPKPSVIIFRQSHPRRPAQQAELLARILPKIAEDLEKGCVVVIEDTRLRIRPLPIL